MCSRCAAPCPEHESQAGSCTSCRGVKYAFDGAMALGLYEGPLRQAVLRTKHARHERLAVDLGRLLASDLRNRSRNGDGIPLDQDASQAASPRIVAAVPMFWLQRAYRGANGAERMAAGVAEALGLSFAPRALMCRRFLRKQSELKPAERRRNVREAFRASWWQPIAGRRDLTHHHPRKRRLSRDLGGVRGVEIAGGDPELPGDVLDPLASHERNLRCRGDLVGEELGQHAGRAVGVVRIGEVLEVEDRDPPGAGSRFVVEGE